MKPLQNQNTGSKRPNSKVKMTESRDRGLQNIIQKQFNIIIAYG